MICGNILKESNNSQTDLRGIFNAANLLGILQRFGDQD